MICFTERRVIEGCKLPSTDPLTGNELAWIEFLRIAYADQVPAPNFDQVVQLRQIGQWTQCRDVDG